MAKKLNSDLYELSKQNLGEILPANLPNFYSGESIEGVCKVVSKVAPFGKVAVVYTKYGFSEFSKNLTTGLKRIGVKPINFIMPDLEFLGGIFSLENLYELFYFPEDVRAVITLESNLICEISYYASILNIPAVYCINSLSQYNLLPYRVNVKNFNRVDEVIITCKRHIIIDERKILDCKDCSALTFAYIQSKIPAFLDYTFNLLISGKNQKNSKSSDKENNKVYNYAVQALKETYSIIAQPIKDINLNLLYNLLKINFVNCLLKGELLDYSSIYCALNLLKNDSAYTMLNLSLKIIGIYQLFLSNQYNETQFFPDYNKRAESLSFATGENIDKFLQNFESQLKTMQSIKNLEKIKDVLYKKIIPINEDLKKILNTYFALNGKSYGADNLDVNVALKYSGDLSKNLNIMSFVRESGITELF